MHHLFRLRHLGILTAVIGVGLIPLYAAPNLGAAESFAVLAENVTITGNGTVDVNAVTGGGQGRVGALTYTNATGTLLSDFGAVTTDPTTVNAAITAADSVADALCAAPGGTAFPGAVGGTYTLSPGITYRTAADLTLAAGETVSFSGPGDYTIIVQGDLSVDAATAFALNGAAAANITWIVCGDGLDTTGVTLGAGTVPGRIISAEDITLPSGAAVNGKLIVTGAGGSVIFNPVASEDTITVNDAGTPPSVTVTSPNLAPVTSALPALAGVGTPVNPFVITVGQTLTYTVTATDPDVTGTVDLDSTGDAGLTGYVDGLPIVDGADPVAVGVVYAPTNADAGVTHTITYTATDDTGAVASTTVSIYVNAAPTAPTTSNVSGEAPFFVGGAGTPASPFVTCVGGTLTFDVTGTDPDFAVDALGTNTVTLDVAGETASFSFANAAPATPASGLPASNSTTGTITSTVTYTPTTADGGTTQTLTFTFTDEFGATSTQDVVIFTSSLPTFPGPVTDGTVVTACVGQTLQFDVTANDTDVEVPGMPPTPETVALYVEGVPVGAEHNPNFLGVDSVGPDNDGDGIGGDLLVVGDEDNDGNATSQTSRFEWTPLASDVAASPYTLTYTAEDAAGCKTPIQVTVIVTNPPTLTATLAGNPVTEGQVVTVCPDNTLTIPVTAVDVDGDVVALSATGNPGSFPATSAAGMTSSTLTFTPTVGQAGQTFNVVLTAQDVDSASTLPANTPGVSQCSATATLSFTIRVANVPALSVTGLGNTTVNAGVINVCVGSPVSFRVRATDADAGDSISLTQTSTLPVTAFTPGLPATGNPVETNVTYIPTVAGTTPVTFVATDSAGCVSTTTVTVIASSVPTLTIGSVTGAQSGDGTAANPYVVCATPAAPLAFTVTAADGDVADTVTLSQSGLPGNATFNVAGTNPAVGSFSFSPSAGQGGQTYAVTFTAADNSGAACSVSQTVSIRVSSLPVITATPSTITVCEGEAINFRVRATDAEASNVTIGVPTITNNGGGEGQPVAPDLVLTNTQSLPAAGNPVETVVTATAPEVAVDVTYTITYTATDADGCTATQVVTVTVLNSKPASVALSRTGGDVFGEQICYTAVVTDDCPADLGGPRRLSGIQVCFKVEGTTGNDGQTFAITNANGEAVFCLTPVFPGTLTVTAVIDQNGDCAADDGTTGGTNNVTVPAPVPNSTGTYVTGQGKVDVSDPIFGTIPVIAQFTLDIAPKANGTFKGKVNVLVPSGGTLPNGKGTNVKINSTRIDSVTVTDVQGGRRAVIFGVAKVTGLAGAGLNGTRPFRADVFDGGTPGIPNDSITLTLLDTVGGVAVGPVGGNLGFGRGGNHLKDITRDDIKIRSGVRGR